MALASSAVFASGAKYSAAGSAAVGDASVLGRGQRLLAPHRSGGRRWFAVTRVRDDHRRTAVRARHLLAQEIAAAGEVTDRETLDQISALLVD